MKAWAKHSENDRLSSFIVEVFEVFGESPACALLLQRDALPTLLQIFNSFKSHYSGVLGTALQVLNIIVKGSEDLSNEFTQMLLPCILFMMEEIDDHSVIQAATLTLTYFLPLLQKLPNFASFLNPIYRVLAKLLNPDYSEEAGVCSGQFVYDVLSSVCFFVLRLSI